MKSPIHKKPDEILAENSASTLSAIDKTTKTVAETTRAVKELHSSVKDKSVEMAGFTGMIKNTQKGNTKLEEIKSASLITNKHLKEISSKDKMKVEIEGAEVVTIKGVKGDKGEKGDRGERGEKGDSIKGEKGDVGSQGLTGSKGEKGEKGLPGKDGINGKDGKDGKDGADGKDADEKEILKKVLKKIPDITQDTMNQIGVAVSGANQFVIQNNGTRLSAYVLNLNFGAGLTASYSNGTILVTANTSGSVLAATGTIDDTNLDFTFISQPSVLIINGGTYQQTGGAITWSWNSSLLTATLSTAPGTGGSVFGLI